MYITVNIQYLCTFTIYNIHEYGSRHTICLYMVVHEKLRYGVEGSALISASWASLLSYHTCQSYMVLVTCTILYISLICPCSVSRTYKSSLLSCLCFFKLWPNRKYYSCTSYWHMLALGFRVGTASGIFFSSWLASGKLTTPLQLHVGLQYPGGLSACWNTSVLEVHASHSLKSIHSNI